MEQPRNAESESRKQLVALLTQHQRRIFAYIYTLVPNRTDAEDILQETSLIICEKFHDFKPGTDFVAWACQIAYWRSPLRATEIRTLQSHFPAGNRRCPCPDRVRR